MQFACLPITSRALIFKKKESRGKKILLLIQSKALAPLQKMHLESVIFFSF